MGYCSLLMLQSDCTDQDRNKIEDIQAHALRLNSMLNDMLVMAKMESHHLLLNQEAINLNDLIEGVKTNFEPFAELSKIKLALDLPANPPMVSLDANLFERVLDNLISNAVKFAPGSSTVTLQVEYPPTNLLQFRLKVLDEGIGIPPENRDRIFDKFETVSLYKKSTLQVGLGLAFCKLVVNAHGGQIFVEPNIPTGSIFVVEI